MKNPFLGSYIYLFLVLCGLFAHPAFGQEPADSSHTLPEITVKAYLVERPLLKVTTSASTAGQQLLSQQPGTTLLPALNTLPGVRMEERSPGSYRLSIRGSLLRSPFGVRNVKVYFDELPLTDAGGNTYLNVVDPGSLNRIDLLKGPDGSLYGANSGGVVLLKPNGMDTISTLASVRLNGGSYGLFQEQGSVNLKSNDLRYRGNISESYQRSDGYRQHSGMNRRYLQTVQRFQYNRNNELRLLAFYSDLDYQTPGGLNADQYHTNPKSARPTVGTSLGSVDQKAAIYDKTLFGGLIHESTLSNHLRHVISVFGSYTDFRNPFILNYEKRFENNYGVRTYLDYAGETGPAFNWQVQGGLEWQNGGSRILNYDNNRGQQGNEQKGDKLQNGYHFYFLRWSGELFRKLTLETALSLNYYGYGYQALFPTAEDRMAHVHFKPAWMPRFALSYLLLPQVSWRLSAGKGYSPPTTEEVRASDQRINADLLPETGWNYETGFRWISKDQRFQADASVFYYRMKQAIVSRELEEDKEYFINGGGVSQKGLEAALSAWIIQPRPASFIRGLQLSTNITLNHFRFKDYENYSGNKLTGVPAQVVVSSISILLPEHLSLYVLHNYTSSIPLNDANTNFARRYHLLQMKVSWQKPLNSKLRLQFFAGADNVLNEHYSLGNDINAFGGRYFNAAPLRNFYGGMALSY
ncbi:iron complex outermembrane recepter protein [bacterium A37T11]|nr:iron complex outermembrane recepter protein [bacterium A37T11]